MDSGQSVSDAIEKVAEIHQHLARGEVYRGFRPVAVAVTGIVGILAAGVQPLIIPPGALWGFLMYWIAVALLNVSLHGVAILRNYRGDSDLARRRTRHVLGQFLPGLAVGALLTFAAALTGIEAAIPRLPGVWALLFSLALFSARPFLPRRIGWVALFYFAFGAALLLLDLPHELLGHAMGTVFGFGQIAAAVVLFRDEERHA